MARLRLAPALCSALAVACSGSSNPPAAVATPDGGATVVVGQSGMPWFVTPGAAPGTENQVTVPPGATVTWRFATSGWNVVSGAVAPDGGCVPDGAFCSPSDLSCSGAVPPQMAGTFYQHAFPAVGSYYYFSQTGCPGMTGVVKVQLPDGGP